VVELQEAYASCARLARAHYENFPVASLLLPRAMRDHIAAVYAFARMADDFADEGDRSPQERLDLLDSWRSRLQATSAGPASVAPLEPGEPAETPHIFRALGHTIRAKALPLGLFEDLLSAFRQDVMTDRYDTWSALFDYCRRSANPIGRLVLQIAGYRNPRLDLWSDSICTALQLTNFWQDTTVDAARGRVYLPAETRGQVEPMREAVRRTRALFMDGRPLCDAVRGRLRYELRATWLGGMRILDRIEAGGAGGSSRPRLSIGDLPTIAWKTVSW
jgi:phytoene synthase